MSRETQAHGSHPLLYSFQHEESEFPLQLVIIIKYTSSTFNGILNFKLLMLIENKRLSKQCWYCHMLCMLIEFTGVLCRYVWDACCLEFVTKASAS